MGTESDTAVPPAPLSRTPKRRSHNKPRQAKKLDPDTVLAMHQAGYSMPKIASHFQVQTSSVYRWLERNSEEAQLLQRFKTHRSDVFADLQNKAIDLQKKIIARLNEYGILSALQPQQMSGLLLSLNAVSGTIYDKERLELGKSTSNHSIMHKMMAGAFDQAHKPTASSSDPSSETPSE